MCEIVVILILLNVLECWSRTQRKLINRLLEVVLNYGALDSSIFGWTSGKARKARVGKEIGFLLSRRAQGRHGTNESW